MLNRHRPGLRLLAEIAGLAATGWMIWSVSVVPRLHSQSLARIAAGAIAYALLACLWSAVIVLSLQFAITRSIRADALQLTLRTCRTAVWFAPATILLSRLSPAALIASLALIVSTTRLLHSQWLELFGDSGSSVRLRELAPAQIFSFSFQGALVAPPRPGSTALAIPAARPFTIPFSGQYWIFKQPNRRPPRDSYFQRSNRLALSFVTTDGAPLMMEARRKLDRAMDVTCCGAIQVVISNADRFPGTVALEVILADAAGRRQRLGRHDIISRPQGALWRQPISPIPETLEFAIPATTAVHQFNEIGVVFHRDPMRADRSARISIERFILVPAGA